MDIAVIEELSGYGGREKSVVGTAGAAVVDPGAGAADSAPALAVAAGVEAEVGVGVVAPVAAVFGASQGLGHKFADDA